MRPGNSPLRNPARMLTGMSCRVTRPTNGHARYEQCNGKRSRQGSLTTTTRERRMHSPQLRSLSSEKWWSTRLATTASASIVGRTSAKSPCSHPIPSGRSGGRGRRSIPLTCRATLSFVNLRTNHPSPAPSSTICRSEKPARLRTIQRELPITTSSARRSRRLRRASGSAGSNRSRISGTRMRSDTGIAMKPAKS